VAGRTAIGLDIGTSGVRAAELVISKNGITLERFGQVALPPGAVRDGEVVDVDGVAAAIKSLWEHAKFSGKKVVVGVANQKVIVRNHSVPAAPIAEIKENLPYLIEGALQSISVENYLLDFYGVDEVEENGRPVVRGFVVAAPRDMITTQLAAVQQAGLTPTMVDLTAFAVLRSLAAVDELGMGGPVEALVDVGARVTNIVVHSGGVPRFVRILQMGGQDITEAVAERTGCSEAEAEELKRELGMRPDAGTTEQRAAGRVMDTAGKAFADQVRVSLDYYAASVGGDRVDRLVLTGGGSRLVGLAEELGKAVGAEVVRGRPFAELEIGKTGLSPEQTHFVEPAASVPVGLALGGVA
jgi:type IV pilus assembly protein PilM